MNKNKPHLVIVPEDEAWATLTRGFFMARAEGNIKVDRTCGGYNKEMTHFKDKLQPKMASNPNMHVLLLVDFDRKFASRMTNFTQLVYPDYNKRAFMVGCKDEIQNLNTEYGGGKLEDLGQTMGNICLGDVTAMHTPKGINPWTLPQILKSAVQVSLLKTRTFSFLFA